MRFDAITRKSGVLAISLTVILVAISFVRASLNPYTIELAEGPLADSVISKIVAALLFLASAIITGRLYTNTKLCKSYCTLPIPIYSILACGIAISPHSLASAAVAIIFALALALILLAIERDDDVTKLFVGAILLGVLPLIAAETILLGATIIFAVLLFALSPRQLLTMIVGWVLPLFTTSYIMWYRGDKFIAVAQKMWNALGSSGNFDAVKIPYGTFALLAVILTVVIWGLIRKNRNALVQTRVRRQFWFFVLVAITSLAMFALPNYSLIPLSVLAMPLSIMLSFLLSETSTTGSTIAYWVLLAATVVHLFIE